MLLGRHMSLSALIEESTRLCANFDFPSRESLGRHWAAVAGGWRSGFGSAGCGGADTEVAGVVKLMAGEDQEDEDDEVLDDGMEV